MVERDGRLSKRGRMLFATVMVTMAGTVALTTYVVWWRLDASAEECRRITDGRADARAMFEYLISAATDQTSPQVIAFRNELDERLPMLQCVNSKPVPIDQENP